ncbi:MAG: radical SAM protein [Elusimicrobia bacterium]|nr:radical SAM protein [Elusimicrobiota bacterium]
MKFLLINPYVYDFACYDYWLKPLGLQYISSLLKEKGHEVEFVDCMDRHHESLPEASDGPFGTGSYVSTEAEKPAVLKKYNRKYRIYGIHGKKLNKILESIPRPDMVLMTSSMTYWYMGVRDIAVMIRKTFPGVPLILGGTYATLCGEHAGRTVGPDYIFGGRELDGFFEKTGCKAESFSKWPAPDYSFYGKIPYLAIRTSVGCSRNCSYCGIGKLSCGFEYKSGDRIKKEIERAAGSGNIKDIVFYDDSLLESPGFIEYLESFPGNLRFHTPNGLEVRRITAKTAMLLRKAGFIQPCLSVDVLGAGRQRDKLTECDLDKALENLRLAGYREGEISCYLIFGLPGQELDGIERTAEYLHLKGLRINLAEYALVPGTRDAREFAVETVSEPLLHNNSLFPSYELKCWDKIFKIKNNVRALNNEF